MNPMGRIVPPAIESPDSEEGVTTPIAEEVGRREVDSRRPGHRRVCGFNPAYVLRVIARLELDQPVRVALRHAVGPRDQVMPIRAHTGKNFGPRTHRRTASADKLRMQYFQRAVEYAGRLSG